MTAAPALLNCAAALRRLLDEVRTGGKYVAAPLAALEAEEVLARLVDEDTLAAPVDRCGKRLGHEICTCGWPDLACTFGVPDARVCQWDGCREDALVEPAARGKANEAEVDLYLCQAHRDALARGTTAHVSIGVKPTPARPA